MYRCNASHPFVDAWICFREIYRILVCEASVNWFRNKYDIIFSFNSSFCIFKYIAFLVYVTPGESKHSKLKCKLNYKDFQNKYYLFISRYTWYFLYTMSNLFSSVFQFPAFRCQCSTLKYGGYLFSNHARWMRVCQTHMSPFLVTGCLPRLIQPCVLEHMNRDDRLMRRTREMISPLFYDNRSIAGERPTVIADSVPEKVTMRLSVCADIAPLSFSR